MTPLEVSMLILLAIPVVVAVAFVHRWIQTVAPSNMLVRHVRRSRPRARRALGLAMLSLALIALAHALERMIEAGSAGWLNLLVFILLWDAIKIGLLGGDVLVRGAVSVVQEALRRGAGRWCEGPAVARRG